MDIVYRLNMASAIQYLAGLLFGGRSEESKRRGRDGDS